MFREKKPDPPKEQHEEERQEGQSTTEDAADESTTEEVIQVMSEIDHGEVETVYKNVVVEKGYGIGEGDRRAEEGAP